jgi:2-methylcitrate dehydratase
VVRQVNDIPGFPGRPMLRADIERKFRGNVGKRLPEEQVTSALRGLWELDHATDVSTLMRSLSLDV